MPALVEIKRTDLTCLDSAAATARLQQVLAARNATYADLIIRVDVTPAADALALHVTVTRASGESGLDRTYSLAPADCASAVDLVALGVDRFLDSFPDWATSAPPRPPVAEIADDRWFEFALRGGANGMFGPLGVDADVGGAIDVGDEKHRFGAGLLVRASVPQAAGDGRFQQTAFLGGASYRFASGPWRLRGEARGGALLVSGMGLDTNRRDWLPWWEGAVFAGRAFGWGALGVEVAASGLQHKAVTSDGLVEEDIPLLRLGFAGELGVWSSRK